MTVRGLVAGALLLAAAGCGGRGVLGPDAGAGGVAGAGSGGAGGTGVRADSGTDGKTDGLPDGPGCCPPGDPLIISGCVYLGGYSAYGCFMACDFQCSTNWRLENDDHGCPMWRYDTRQPTQTESSGCVPLPPDAATDRPDTRDATPAIDVARIDENAE